MYLFHKMRMIPLIRTVSHLVLVVLSLAYATHVNAQKDLSELVKNITPSVVVIRVFGEDNELKSLGTGFFVIGDGVLITNYHVMEDGVRAEAKLYNGEIISIGDIISEDIEGDLILLALGIKGRSFPTLKFTDTKIEPGQPVVVIGSPFGLEGTVSDGIVSGVRDIPKLGKIVQITAPISKGSSGSPVLNMRGEVIGVATLSIIEGQSLNFAISADKVTGLVSRMKTPSMMEQPMVISQGDPIPIIMPKWKSVGGTPPYLSSKIYRMLVNSLTLSGLFRVIDYHSLPLDLQEKEGIPNTLYLQEWMPAKGRILLAGETTLESKGHNLKIKFHLFDLTEPKHLIGKQYEGPLKNIEGILQRMSNEVIFQLKGKRNK
jgi:hypothetical protein